MPALGEMTRIDGPLSAHFRRGRWELFRRHVPDLAALTVLDLGGTPQSWLSAPEHPRRVVSVNLPGSEVAEDLPWFESVVGDACEPATFLDRGPFDLVYSNSVVEHVGGHHQIKRFAEAVHAAAPRHWIQTPNRWFPVEPHWVCPGFQFLPLGPKAALSRYWPLGSFRCGAAECEEVVVEDVLAIELLTARQLAHYFPTSRIVRERVGGLSKSFIAVR